MANNNSNWNGHGSWSKMMDAKIKKEKESVQSRNSAYVLNQRSQSNSKK
jgi:hypothetical protein